MMYRGWGLTDESRAELLKRWPAIYPVIRADHVTDMLAGDGLMPPEPATITIYGMLNVPHFQIAACAVDGMLWQSGRQRMFHVTISRDQDVRSSDAGLLLSNSVQAIQPVPRMVLTTVPFVRVLGSKVER